MGIKQILRERLMLENKNLILYHGSQTKISTKTGFSTNFIKSGEGNNIFGWGLYFTDNIEVAKKYGKNNSANVNNRYISLAKDDFKLTNIDAVIKKYKQALPDFEMFDPEQYINLNKFIKFLLDKKKEGFTDTSKLVNPGFVYTVEITPSKPNLFNWVGDLNGGDFSLSNETQKGSTIYKELINKLGNDEKTSKYLYNLGYYGIIYPIGTIDASHGGDGYNYVIFNDKDVKVINID